MTKYIVIIKIFQGEKIKTRIMIISQEENLKIALKRII